MKRFSGRLPLLHIDIEIPFVRIRTAINRECIEAHTVEYVSLYIDIWKWRYHVSLYDNHSVIRRGQ